MLYLKAPDPERFLPWKLGQRRYFQTSEFPPFHLFPEFDILVIQPVATWPNAGQNPNPNPHQPSMSRKFDRARQTHVAALDILKASVRPKPRWIPRFLWKVIYWTAARIIFK